MNRDAIERLKKLQKKEPTYQKRALYQATIELLQEQKKRIELAEAEIDGRSWDRQSW